MPPDELLDQFVLEGRDLVAQATEDLLAMERQGYDAARTASAFRAIHTLKGSAGLFDMAPMGDALHAAEDLMAELRQAGIAPGPAAMAALLACMDAAETWIESVARCGALPPDAAAQAATLARSLRAPSDREAAANQEPHDESWLPALLARHTGGQASSAVRYLPAPGCFFLGDDPLALVRDIPDLLALRILPRAPWSLAEYDPFACNLEIQALSATPADTLRALFRFVPDQAHVMSVPNQASVAAPAPAPDQPAPDQPAPAARSLRVPSAQIDALAGLVEELFAARNRLAHLAAAAAETPLARDLAATEAEFGRLAGLMHQTITSLRLVPLDQTLRRLPRLVRELAVRLGRDVAFTIEGAAVQADKTTVDGLFEPLLHLLRNAVDHGIAPPAARRAAGKPAQGRVALSAALEGTAVVITLSDDGAGIDPMALRRAAAARGIAAPAARGIAAPDARGIAAPDALDNAALRDLIFLPGFSTAACVTDTSGRGVGLDAVRAAIQALGGQVGVAPLPSGGTIFRLAVPQSAAVLGVVMVESGGQQFGVPIEAIEEMALVARDAISPVQAGHAFALRGATVPLLGLAGLLGRPPPAPSAPAAAAPAPAARIMIARLDGHLVGIEVDGFGARAEMVLRPLPALLAATPGLRGTAVLGDGSVLLVLDLPGLLQARPAR